MKINDEFIKAYKELEDTARNVGSDIYTIEKEFLSDREQRMLQLCRLKRNWIQHEDNNNNFEVATDMQIIFIQELTLNIKRKNGICKDFMKTLAKQGCCTSKDSLLMAAQTLSKKKVDVIPVIDGNLFLGVITKEVVSNGFADGATKATKIGKYIKEIDIKYVNENDPVPEKKEPYLVTKGRNKKIVGVLFI